MSLRLRGSQLVRALGSASALLFTLAGACDLTRPDPDDKGPDLPSITSRLNVGEATTCALASTNQLYCWGKNSAFLEYGPDVGTVPQSSTPVYVRAFDFLALNGGHGQHMCGLITGAAARCWGRNTSGQIGGNSPTATGSAQTGVAMSAPWSSISVSRLSTCGVTTERKAYCWGSNQRGEGGSTARAIATNALKPVQIDGAEDYQSTAAGWLHSCGLTIAGVAMCWGDNREGQLGLGMVDSAPHFSPAPVVTTVRFQQLSAGANYTCGISLDGTAYCWGQNVTGQLGDGTTNTRLVPTGVATAVKFARVYTSTGFASGALVGLPSSVPGGVGHTCAMTISGSAYCWGWNGAGQLGDGTTVSKLAPVAVSGGLAFDEMGLGGTHTCGRRVNNIYCWGGNAEGQLGNGQTTNSSAPIPVSAPFRGN